MKPGSLGNAEQTLGECAKQKKVRESRSFPPFLAVSLVGLTFDKAVRAGLGYPQRDFLLERDTKG